MEIKYQQLSLEEALKTYAEWLVEQGIGDPKHHFERCGEWYMLFYPLRALMLCDKLFGKREYADLAFKYIDIYLSEQLPNGAFTSNYRRQPTEKLSKKEFQEILCKGKVNLADNGSNVTGVIQAAMMASGERRARYLEAARKWFDLWVPIWALPEGGYGNGIWQGHKLNSPYTCAISNVATAFAAFSQATGEKEYIENAERCISFQCANWLPYGCPIAFDCYPVPRKTELNDYGHSFYLLEGMCWTHHVSENAEVRKLIESRLTEWIFGKKGLLSQWRASWFYFQISGYPPDWDNSEFAMSRLGLRPGWELAKSNGILHAFSYYLNHVNNDSKLREKFELGLRYLSNPLKARMSGVCSDPEESYGEFTGQATGFAVLSLAEGIEKDSVFNLKG
jgi:hypothetical protein